jgi:hypothetical protein
MKNGTRGYVNAALRSFSFPTATGRLEWCMTTTSS